MSQEEFNKQVRQGLKKFNRQEKIEFAWRCAVRVLPLLVGNLRAFSFWDKERRQNHLFSVFYALDMAALAAYAPIDATAAAAAADAANAYAYAYAYAYANAAAANASSIKKHLKSLILNDLQNNLESTQLDFIHLYGSIWTDFQKALKEEGCTYWGKLYQSIFENNLKLDQKALESLNKRINLPIEIRKQGAAIVAGYLEEAEKGVTHLNEARIIILGDKGSGKTSLARRLLDPNAEMPTVDESTAGVDTLVWKLDDKKINASIWDFAGHTVTHAVHQFFLSERCLYLIVYNGRTEENNRLEYWLNHMKNYGGNSKAIILVNKQDQHSPTIKANFLKEHYHIEDIYYFSIKEDKDELEAFRLAVAGYIENNPSWEKQEIPLSYYHVKEELEKLFSKEKQHQGQEHISRETFDQIADRYKVEDKEPLLESLHCLGISLWYKDMAGFDTLVLNPEWISHGVSAFFKLVVA